jgi:murein DD-endopeptidase MepM/ murein hydrolase activator NlpD
LLRGAPDPRWIAAARGRTPERVLWPVDEGRWVRGFGYVRRTRPDLIHRGADISADTGSTVRAAADGIVAYSDNGVHGYGNVVMIVHPNGWMTLYAHSSRTTVQAGYRVHRGERIALVGSTGIAHGPHVHFELWDNGHAIDPAPLFDGGPPYIERLGERAAAHGDVPPPREVTAVDRPVEAPLPPHPDDGPSLRREGSARGR